LKKLKTFIFNTLILLVSSIAFQLISIYFNTYVSNKIGQEALGLFSLVLSVYIFGITLASAGINIASTRLISEELACTNESGAKKIAKKCILISFFSGLLASIIFFVFSNFIIENCLHKKVSVNIIYAICLALPFTSMSAAINGYFTAVRRVSKNAISKFLEELVKVLSTIFILNLFLPNTINSICLSLIVGDVISEIISFFCLYILYIHDKKHLTSYTRYKDTEKYTKRILKISLPVALTSYLRSGLSTLKQLLIPLSLEKNGMSCSSALKKYGLIGGMVMPIILFPSVIINSFSSLLIPELSRYYAKNDYIKIKKFSIFILIITLIFSIFITILIFILSDALCFWLYKSVNISKYVKLFCPLISLIYLDIVIDSILKGINKQVSVMLINILDCIISVLFIYFLVPVLGFRGYILSIFISELINFVFSLSILVKVLKLT